MFTRIPYMNKSNLPQRVRKPPSKGLRPKASVVPKAPKGAPRGLIGPSLPSGSFFSKRAPSQGRNRQVSAASAYATGQSSMAPNIVASRDSARIVHRELIGSVVGTAAFTAASSFALNPGLASSFPWLATQAQAWETYRFNKLRFCYYTRTGSSTPGSAMLVPDYDANDASPASEQIASSYEDVAEDAPWKDICCELRPSAMHSMGPKKFVRTGPVPAGTDVKTYDCGKFFLCTTDGTAVNWGKLWVEYDVSLYTPQLPAAGAGVIASQHLISLAPTTASNFAASVSTGSPLVTTALDVMTFAIAGSYLITGLAAGTTVTFNNPSLGAGVVEIASIFGGQSEVGTGTNSLSYNIAVSTPAGGTVTIANTYVAGTSNEVVVSQLQVGMV